MKINHVALAVLLGGALAGQLSANTGANVQCWAPGMGSQIVTITSYGGQSNVSFGKPFRYEIYGVAGRITLGNRMHVGGVNGSGLFASNPNANSGVHLVNSTSSVKLLVNGELIYPRLISVTGERPGVTYGPVRLYGDSWITGTYAGHYPDTTLSFKLAGTESGDYVNANPYGYFYVIGEYHAVPPMPVGELTVDRTWVIAGSKVQVGYKILRIGSAETVPPFADYDPNQEVIEGEAPPRPQIDGHTSPDGETQYPIATEITMEADTGTGWVKIHNSRSGILDGTNPGRGSGRTNSPSTGIDNPNQSN